RNAVNKASRFTALSGVMRYTTGGQDAHPTRVLLLKFVPHSNGICCNSPSEFNQVGAIIGKDAIGVTVKTLGNTSR
ncbi:MAG: hypothetical protein ACKPKP_15290, partial [Dolichospermum sp.]